MVYADWGPGPVNTNWGPGPVNTNWGPRLGAKQRAGGQEIHIPLVISLFYNAIEKTKRILNKKAQRSNLVS